MLLKTLTRCVLCASVAATLVSVAHSQEAAPPPAAAPPQSEVRVFNLQNALAESVAEVVQRLAVSANVIADERTNSLIVTAADTAELEVIEALLMRLDSSDANGSARVTQVIPLKLRADLSLEQTLATVADNVDYSIDPDRKVVVVRGARNEVDRIIKLLDALEQFTLPEERGEKIPESATLRVVWLMNGIEQDYAQPVPEGMETAIATLEKVGIRDLQLVTQLLIGLNQSEGPFTVSGTLHLPNEVHVSVEGVGVVDGRVELSVETEDSMSQGQRGGREIVRPSATYNSNLRATLALRPGQMAVLGAAPCGPHDSVFVVQLLE